MIKHTNLIHKLIYESFSIPSIYYKKIIRKSKKHIKNVLLMYENPYKYA